MPKLSKGARDFWSHVFGNQEPEQLEQELEIIDEQSVETRRGGKQPNRPSLYVGVFEGKGIDLLHPICLSLNLGDRYGEYCHGEGGSFT